MVELAEDRGLSKLDPFFEKISKYAEKSEKAEKKSGEEFDKGVDADSSNEMVGKSANRKLEEKWNIKLTLGPDFFAETFSFLKEMSYSTIFRLSKQGIKIYVIDPSGTHASYVFLDRTELAEYVVDGLPIGSGVEGEVISTEKVIYVDMDVLEEMLINLKYPIDIYFDTIVRNRMYIVNGKEIVSRRLNSLDNKDTAIGTYETYHEKIMGWIKREDSSKVLVHHNPFKSVLSSLEKKKSKKEKSSTMMGVKFGKTEIDFFVGTEIKSSSIQMYGDDIMSHSTQEVNLIISLETLVKFAKLKLKNEVLLYVSDKAPLVLETKFGAGRIIIYYVITPRVENE